MACLLPATSLYLGADLCSCPGHGVRRRAGGYGQRFQPRLLPLPQHAAGDEPGCLRYRLTPEEVLTAVTLNGAAAIAMADKVGSVEEGKQGDLVIWEAEDLSYLCYRMGSNLVRTVVKSGQTYFNTTRAN